MSDDAKRKRRPRGVGSTYLRGDTYWLKYYLPVPGGRAKCVRESAETTNLAEAEKLLKRKVGHATAARERGEPTGPDVERTTIGDIATMALDDWRVRELLKTKRHAPLDHVARYFGARRIDDDDTGRIIRYEGGERVSVIDSARVTEYVRARRDEGDAPATINRSLAALKRSYTLALRAKRVAHRPYIEMLPERNARSGFLSHAEFIRLRDALPADLKDPVAFLYHSGWRVGEMRSLQWRDVDLAGGVVRLRPENSKSKQGRVLPLQGELKAIVERADARRSPDCANVFRRDDGNPIGLFRKSWMTACTEAGLGAIIVHDLRRTAVRNLVRAGVSEHTAMAITGHKTRSIFARYDIIDEADLTAAIQKVGDHLAAQPQRASNVVPLKRVV